MQAVVDSKQKIIEAQVCVCLLFLSVYLSVYRSVCVFLINRETCIPFKLLAINNQTAYFKKKIKFEKNLKEESLIVKTASFRYHVSENTPAFLSITAQKLNTLLPTCCYNYFWLPLEGSTVQCSSFSKCVPTPTGVFCDGRRETDVSHVRQIPTLNSLNPHWMSTNPNTRADIYLQTRRS